MPHLIKEYSKSFGTEPKKPIVNKHFYPVMSDNYIVIYNEQEIQSKSYGYYPLVIDILKSFLERQGIDVVILGSSKNVPNRAEYAYCDLSFRKNCYIISKAKLIVSIDNALTQYASSVSVPVVNLYGNIYSSITTPYWSNKNEKEDLEPKWDKKPCFSLVDNKESIDTIPPEKVVSSILKLLGVSNFKEINFKTILTNKIKKEEIDIIPTKYVNLPFFKDSILNIRLDQVSLDSEGTNAFLTYCSNHKCNIILKNVVFQPESLAKIANNVNSLTVIVDKPIDAIPKEYFDFLRKNKITFLMLVNNKDLLESLRLEYFDENVELYNPPKQKPDNIKVNHKFLSFKNVVDGDKIYKSLAHWKKGIDSDVNIVDNADYWEELDYFYIYEQENNN